MSSEPLVPPSSSSTISALTPGRRLGPYEIVAPLGAGGMGEVYRARDTRLDRTVAIKVLPAHLSMEPEVRARFEREARAVSSLNHPHICTLYDVGHDNGVDYLVMEHLEGETLAERIARGPLPTGDLLRIGAQIADALDRAHRQGLIHRDLKPANVMLTKQGAKLLDFGLARVAGIGAAPPGSSRVATIGSGAAGTGATPPGMHPAFTPSSPTMGRALTAEGSIVGTFQYMSPEQLEGQEADARSDLWAFGATLYEMATGRRAFEGASQASLIASILKEQPRSIAELVPLAPPALDRLVRGCLAKDPEERLQTAHDVKLQLQWIAEGGSQAGVPVPVAAARRRHERLAWILAGASTVAAIAFAAWAFTRPVPVHHTTRFDVIAPMSVTQLTWPKLSPDGRTLAFQGRDSSGAVGIYVRRFEAVEPVLLPNTADAGRPFWSPDGSHLAYFSEGRLKKIPAGGGPVQLVAETPGGFDGTWGAGGVVLFDGNVGDSIRAVSASGGVPSPATRLDHATGETTHGWPLFLPDGKHFLFTASFQGGRIDRIRLGHLGTLESADLDSTESRVEYVAPGYILFVRSGTLLARRLDLGAKKCVGEPFAVVEGMLLGQGSGNFSGSANGTIAFQAQGSRRLKRIEAVDRSGKVLAQIGETDDYGQLAVSPDGTKLALSIFDLRTDKSDIWVRDLKRGTLSRLTFNPGNDMWPIWSPDGQRIAFSSDRLGPFRMFTKYASGAGDEVLVPGQSGGNTGPTQWSADGTRIAGQVLLNGGTWDAFVTSPTDSTQWRWVARMATFFETQPRLSPDGRWVAFHSNESGVAQVYVQSFPEPVGKWQISTQSGIDPWWSGDGREILYRQMDGKIMSVPVSVSGASLEAGTPALLFEAPPPQQRIAEWQATVDGQRFYLQRMVGDRAAAPVTVVENWSAEVAKR
ncbi:MAG: protein kinase domain-containing protein [Candidatus Eiseniibacteriota bacterium]